MIETAIAPPGPKDWLPGWSFLQLYRDPLAMLERTARDFPDVALVPMGRRNHYLVTHPDYIRDILLAPEEVLNRSFAPEFRRLMGKGLLSSQGEFHRTQRRSMQPLFHGQQIGSLAEMIVRQVDDASAMWRPGETRDMSGEMSRLAFAVAVEALFGDDAGRAHDLEQVTAIAIRMTGRMGYLLAAITAKLPRVRQRRHAATIRRLDELMASLIARRRNVQSKGAGAADAPADLLAMLMALRSEDGAPAFSDAQLRDESVTLLFAGHETVATALSWTLYLLAQNPGAERQMHDELDRVLDGRTPALEDLPRLTFTAAVLNESLRLYPPVWMIVRRPLREWRLGKYRIPAGSYLDLSPWVVHRDPRYFPEPGRFDASRWLPANVASRPKFSYFPFGGGGRKCIGESLAMLECLLVLVRIAQKWRLQLAPGHRVEPAPLITLRPKYGMKMKLERR